MTVLTCTDDYVTSEILEAREVFCNRNTKEKEYNGMVKGRMILLMNCSCKMEVLVNATLNEALTRKLYLSSKWNRK